MYYMVYHIPLSHHETPVSDTPYRTYRHVCVPTCACITGDISR